MKLRLLFAFSIAGATAQAMDQESALHVAARQNNYDACLQQLVNTAWLEGELLEKALFPQEAFAAMTNIDTNPTERVAAQQRVLLFAKRFNEFAEYQLQAAQRMKRTLNAQKQTPQDIAREAQAPGKLLGLLNQNNTIIVERAILAHLSTKLRTPEGSLTAAIPTANPHAPIFKPGTETIIDGVAYKCTSEEKVLYFDGSNT